MTTIQARVPAGRSIDLSDLTDSEVATEFASNGDLIVTLTPDVADAVACAIKVRMISLGPTDEAIRNQIADLLDQDPSAARDAALTEALAHLALDVS